MGTIRENLEEVRRRLENAAMKAGRSMEDVHLLGISKRKPAEDVLEAFDSGLLDFGENRVQEAVEKIPAVGQGPHWHFVGHVQSNKAKPVAELFSVIHSIDSVRIARRLSRLVSEANRTIDIMIQVDLAGEKTKHGMDPEILTESAPDIASMPALNLVGLMTIPPFFPDPEEARPFFKRLRKLQDKLNEGEFASSPLRELSMGMTNDFEVAVEEGATWVRVGTAIFGKRAN